MKLLVIGGHGQLGWELTRMAEGRDWPVTAVDLPDFDVTIQDRVDRVVRETAPDVVVNASAYTAVDRAEEEPDLAERVNRDGPRFLAQACRDQNCPLVHVSTDYVFDGKKTDPYLETDPVRPLGAYGRSKAAGELAVRETWEKSVIVRTAWLYGVHGNNFVKTMIRLAKDRPELRVVADQVGCPTDALDLAEAILGIAGLLESACPEAWGTFHWVGAGQTSWHGFAEKIIEIAKNYWKLKTEIVHPITTAEYPLPAPRPAHSVLDCRNLIRILGYRPPPWPESLERMIQRLSERPEEWTWPAA